MDAMLTAASNNSSSTGGNFMNFYRSASSFDRVSQVIYFKQAFYIYYTLRTNRSHVHDSSQYARWCPSVSRVERHLLSLSEPR